MSINISYSKIYHRARILDAPEEEGVTNMPDRKGRKDDTFKKCIWVRLSNKAVDRDSGNLVNPFMRVTN